MKISLHKKGLALYVLALASGLAFSSIYGGPVSFAWLYALLLLLPLSALYIFVNYSFLRVYQEIEVHRIVRGEDHRYRAKIENAGPLPIHMMRLLTYGDRCDLHEVKDGQEISLGPFGKEELRSGILCRYAGSYDIGIRKVVFSDPFSIFSAELNVPYTFRAVVSPPVTGLADDVLDLENLINSTGLKSSRLTEEIPGSDLRPYQRGDSLGSINWKVSARLSKWMTRIPDKMEKRTVTVLLLASSLPPWTPDISFLEKRDFFLEFAVSAAWHFAAQGVPVRLVYPAGKVTSSTVDSYESFLEFYGTLADRICYDSEAEFLKLQALAETQRRSVHDDDTWVLIREDPPPGEDPFLIIG